MDKIRTRCVSEHLSRRAARRSKGAEPSSRRAPHRGEKINSHSVTCDARGPSSRRARSSGMSRRRRRRRRRSELSRRIVDVDVGVARGRRAAVKSIERRTRGMRYARNRVCCRSRAAILPEPVTQSGPPSPLFGHRETHRGKIRGFSLVRPAPSRILTSVSQSSSNGWG